MTFNIIIHNVNSNRRSKSYEELNMLDTCCKEWLFLHQKIIYNIPQPIIMLQEVSYEWADTLTINLQNEKYVVHYNTANKTLFAYPEDMVLIQMKTIAVSDFRYNGLFIKLKQNLEEVSISEKNTSFLGQFYNYLTYWVNEKKPVDMYTSKNNNNIRQYINVIEKLADRICPAITCFELKHNDYGRSITFVNIVFKGNVVDKYQKYLVWIMRVLLYYLGKTTHDKSLVVAAYMQGIDTENEIYKTVTQPDTLLYVNDIDLCVPEIDREVCKNGIRLNDGYVTYHNQSPPCTRNTIIDDVFIRETSDYVFINKHVTIKDFSSIPDSIETIPNKHIFSDHYPFELSVFNNKLV